MKKFSIWPAVILSVLLIAASAFLVSKIIKETDAFKKDKQEIAKMLDFNNRLLDVKEAIPLLGDWIWSSKQSKYEERLQTAEAHYVQAKEYGNILLCIAIGVFLIFILMYYKINLWFGITFGSLSVALVFLITGLLSPMLEMEAYKENLAIKVAVNAQELVTDFNNTIKEIPYVGEYASSYVEELLPAISSETYEWSKVYPDKIYFFYQNKGIFDLVHLLWTSGNLPMAIVIGLFSVIVPIIKLLFSFYMLVVPVKRMSKARKILAYLTKFSMLDVMVASSFVTYFSFGQMDAGIETSSTVLMGMYFFCGYVLLAIFSGIALDKLIAKRNL